jgi:hypothetical protein
VAKTKRGKSKRPHTHCQVYLTRRKRMKNKTRKLGKFIEHLEKERLKPAPINPNTKKPSPRRPIKNIIKSCKVGRKKEKLND